MISPNVNPFDGHRNNGTVSNNVRTKSADSSAIGKHARTRDIETIKAQVQNGSYSVDVGRLASSVLSSGALRE